MVVAAARGGGDRGCPSSFHFNLSLLRLTWHDESICRECEVKMRFHDLFLWVTEQTVCASALLALTDLLLVCYTSFCSFFRKRKEFYKKESEVKMKQIVNKIRITIVCCCDLNKHKEP